MDRRRAVIAFARAWPPVALLAALAACEPADLPLETANVAAAPIGPNASEEAFASHLIQYCEDELACMRLGPLRSLSGVWIDAHEGQHFVPDANSMEDVLRNGSRIWLSFSDHDRPIPFPADGHARAFRIAFQGRVARYQAGAPIWFGYGHGGLFNGLVVAEYDVRLDRLQVSDREWRRYSEQIIAW